jgi:hypothetical protein
VDAWLFVAPFPLIVWGADELRRYLLRKQAASPEKATMAGPSR